MKIFVDTNIFLRFLLKDHPLQSPACYKLFEKAERGKAQLVTISLVIAEVVWVLNSLLKKPKNDIIEKLKTIILFKSLEIVDRDILIIAIGLFENKNIDFTDAYVSSWLSNQKINKIYSYDRDFDKIEDLSRIEP